MNASEMIKNSQISQMNINDNDTTVDGSKTFSDIKASIAKAIDTIDAALPKMKAAGIDMQKASFDARGLFRNIIRKGWGDNEVSFYTTRNGGKAILTVTARNLDDIEDEISEFVAKF